MTEYRATVHTLEILDSEATSDWACKVGEKKYPYVGNITAQPYKSGYKIKLNPHKMNKDTDGNAVRDFSYAPISVMRQRLDRISQDLSIDVEGKLSRVDICIDTEIPYTDNAKMLRFICSLLAVQGNYENCYSTVDPIDFTPKTTRMANRAKHTTLEVEHYNRDKLDQSQWNYHVSNRLELRMMGQQMGKVGELSAVVDKWCKWLSECRSAQDKLFEALNKNLFARFMDCVGGSEKRGNLGQFILFNQEYIYTRKQVRSLFKRYAEEGGGGNAEDKAKAFFKGYRGRVKLFTDTEVGQELEAITEALRAFQRG